MNDEYMSGFVSLLIVIITLAFTFYFKNKIRPILLVNNDINLENTNFGQTIMRQQQQNYSEFQVKAISNPFMIKMNAIKSSLDDGLYVSIVNNNPTKPFNLLVAWSVEIERFFDEIENSIYESFYRQDMGERASFLKSYSTVVDHKNYLENEYNGEELHFKVPEKCLDTFKQFESSSQKRTSYHAAFVLYRCKNDLETVDINDIVVNIWIIHLKDKKLSSRVVQNYSKCLNDRIININTIYETQEESMCVVCLSERSNQVLLPCSHNCLCSTCLPKVNFKCPVCRSSFTKSFKI